MLDLCKAFRVNVFRFTCFDAFLFKNLVFSLVNIFSGFENVDFHKSVAVYNPWALNDLLTMSLSSSFFGALSHFLFFLHNRTRPAVYFSQPFPCYSFIVLVGPFFSSSKLREMSIRIDPQGMASTILPFFFCIRYWVVRR